MLIYFFIRLQNKHLMSQTHLVILIHGMDGLASDMQYFAARLLSDKIHCLSPTANQWNTKDGINAGARRILVQIEEELKLRPNIREISYIGHSLGGIYARELLYIAQAEDSPVNKLRRVNFITLASPHVGARQHNSLLKFLVPHVLGRTGKEMMLVDDVENPILLKMTTEPYLQLLKSFKKLILYSNVLNDFSVPYCTSAIRSQNIMKHLIKEHGTIIEDHDEFEPISVLESNDKIICVINTIRNRLGSLPWIRYACFFSRPLLAHTDIINKALPPLPGSSGVWPKNHPVVEHVAGQIDMQENKE